MPVAPPGKKRLCTGEPTHRVLIAIAASLPGFFDISRVPRKGLLTSPIEKKPDLAPLAHTSAHIGIPAVEEPVDTSRQIKDL